MDLTLLAGKAGSADRFIDTVKQGFMGSHALYSRHDNCYNTIKIALIFNYN